MEILPEECKTCIEEHLRKQAKLDPIKFFLFAMGAALLIIILLEVLL